ncbi:MAG TPA: zinc-dependent metalloprotease [Nocardioides sp.]|uniref:zinc-dependent metalloprotease n=1 Tax=Nocardioides sp. TaxID=35761 RepID=UPI002B6ABD78|nr:zinc-dependent metalloprotease [Nocardioides sp.]HQR26512.1 zinc-dependent metalloprotease [Nocardioides sp.]
MSANMVDWELAVALGSRVAGDGPAVSTGEAQEVVTGLRADAERSTGLVRDYTGLVAEERTAPVLVVNRAGWVEANAAAFSTVMDPVVARLTEAKGAPSGLSQALGSRVTGAEVGLLLGFLGSRVLGQFDPFHDPSGRLLLVAPNIVHAERQIRADPADFRLWVCLHEETHRVQFTAVPWMREHLFAQVQDLVDTVEPTRMAEDLVAGASRLLRGGGSLLDVVGTPEQREVLDRVTGVMSLLEGHADVVMDGVGPSVIPSVAQIRRAFDRRRQGVGVLDRLLRRLLGLEAKMAQYRDGAKFVRGVVAKVGMEEFNAVWAAPEHLPSRAEIGDPSAWVARVLG